MPKYGYEFNSVDFSGVRGNVQVTLEGPERGRTVLAPDEDGTVLAEGGANFWDAFQVIPVGDAFWHDGV